MKYYLCILLLLSINTKILAKQEAARSLDLDIVIHETRGAWLATIHNIDWPSSPSIPQSIKKMQLISILDEAVRMNLNSIYMQVRPAGDTFYNSLIEPWSTYLTGKQGKAPKPFWDPLSYAVEEAHKRGLELHAWINPYRAGYTKQTQFSRKHILRKRPDLVRVYGDTYWLDPGDPEVQEYIILIVLDLVKRYNIDGIHLDDYFYPYPQNGQNFNDKLTFNYFSEDQNDKAAWRRANIDTLVRQLYQEIKKINSNMVFGISPFGIWKNNTPNGIFGLDSYKSLHTDSRKWLKNGWVDYIAPQLYWEYNSPRQSFNDLLTWWLAQNTADRLLYSGINVARIDEVKEGEKNTVEFLDLEKKVLETRNKSGSGVIFYSIGKMLSKEWLRNIKKLFPQQALPPIRNWEENKELDKPSISIKLSKGSWDLRWELLDKSRTAKYWVLYFNKNAKWEYKIFPARIRGIKVKGDSQFKLDSYAIAAVDTKNKIGAINWFSSLADQYNMQNISYND